MQGYDHGHQITIRSCPGYEQFLDCCLLLDTKEMGSDSPRSLVALCPRWCVTLTLWCQSNLLLSSDSPARIGMNGNQGGFYD